MELGKPTWKNIRKANEKIQNGVRDERNRTVSFLIWSDIVRFGTITPVHTMIINSISTPIRQKIRNSF